MDPEHRDVEVRLRLLSNLALIGAAGALVFTLTTIVVLVFIGLSAQRQVDKVASFAQQNHDALCSFQADLKHRRDAGALYLAQHPSGLTDRFGNVIISAQQLRSSIKGQTSTLIALGQHLRDCPKEGSS